MQLEFSGILGGLALIFILALAVVPVVKAISADGKVQYCYVETERHMVPNQADVVVYSLHGFRPWRSDRTLAPALTTMDQVKEAAAKYGCELR